MSPHAGFADSLVADGVDLTRSDGRILIRITHGLYEQWDVRGRDTTIPAADGQVPRNRKRDRLVILGEGEVQGTGTSGADQLADAVASMDALRALMDPTQDPYTLVATRMDGSSLSIEARPLNILWQSDKITVYREVSLEWLAVGDDWLGAS